MMKRMLCAILTLILLVSCIPADVFAAKAANYTMTEDAITVLKQLQPFQEHCNERGYIGYNTKCTHSGTHGLPYNNVSAHVINEKTADTALRASLNDTAKAVNNFASRVPNMTQAKFDALVIFSHLYGNAWMSGSSGFKQAVVKGLVGSDFLESICTWQATTTDDRSCMVIANMYLYGYYSSAAPSYFIRVTLNAGTKTDISTGVTYEGVFATYNSSKQIDKYYDLKSNSYVNVVPTMILGDNKTKATFLGWGVSNTKQERLQKLTSAHHNATLTGEWEIYDYADHGYAFTMDAGQLESALVYPNAGGNPYNKSYVSGKIYFDTDFIDKNGIRWGRIAKADYYHNYELVGGAYTFKDYKNWTYTTFDSTGNTSFWVKIGKYNQITETNGSGVTGPTIDIEVTVTNAYLNRRVDATATSLQNGTYYQGDKLRIINVENGTWGQVARSKTDNTPVGWVALMYTNYGEVIAQTTITSPEDFSTVVARAEIKVKGYVNVRDGAGTVNTTIVGSYTEGVFVDIYEIKFVNGQRWGRTKLGWICLSYANVTLLKSESSATTAAGFSSYVFTGKIKDITQIHRNATIGALSAAEIAELEKDLKPEQKLTTNSVVTITHVFQSGNDTWGYVLYNSIRYGWVILTSKDTSVAAGYKEGNFDLDTSKFFVAADNATIRVAPYSGSERKMNLSKGTEVNVTMITADETTIWGYIDKEVAGKYPEGWVNLSSKYFSRNNAPEFNLGTGEDGDPMYATIVGTAEVRVRMNGDLSSTIIGSLQEGKSYKVLGEKDGWYILDVDTDNNPNTDSWVYGQYLQFQKLSELTGTGAGTGTGTTGGAVKTGTGVVVNTQSGVNVRSGPGTGYALMGKILPGTSVEIRLVKQVGKAEWGKTIVNGQEAWVCMDYVAMIDYKEFAGESGAYEAGSTGNGTGSTVLGAVPAVYTGVIGDQITGDAYDTGHYGSVVNASLGSQITVRGWDKPNPYSYNCPSTVSGNRLVVFSEPDIGSNAVRFLNTGDAITLYEILTVEEEVPLASTGGTSNNVLTTGAATVKVTTIWARINDGYIKAPGDNLVLDALDEDIYTLVDYEKLYIYKDTTSGFTSANVQDVTTTVGDTTTTTKLSLKKGDQVRITNVEIHGTSVYGYVELMYTITENGLVDTHYTGWIELAKMQKGAVAVQTQTTTPPADTGAGTGTGTGSGTGSGGIIGSTGDTGTNTGFVPVGGSAVKYIGTVVNVTDPVNNPLKARHIAGDTGGNYAATYTNGNVVNIYETVLSGNMAWGRTDAGWVYLWYVRMRPASGNAIDVNIIRNPNTVIYKDASGDDANGTYVQQAVVEVFEYGESRVRTNLGWVNKTDLLHG